jgi:hypothetical protein
MKEAGRMITATKRARERARVERWMATPTNRARARVGRRDGDGNSGGGLQKGDADGNKEGDGD